MATNELVSTTCTQGHLVLTDKSISVKPLSGPRKPFHWNVRPSSLSGVRITGYGPTSQVIFLARDGRELVADRVPAADAQRIAGLFRGTAQLLGTLAPTTSTTPPVQSHPHPVTPITATATNTWQNAPTTPSFLPQPVQQANVRLGSWWQRYRSASRPFQAGIGCGALLVVCAFCSVLSLAFAAANTPTQPSASSTNTPALAAQQSASATATARPTPKPTPTSTPKPKPTNTPVPPPPPTNTPAPACDTGGAPPNPWCYTFSNTGKLITNPPSNFCGYFNCIKSFWTSTNGYVDECNDGTYSHSGGVQGACSSHGGEMRPLYQP